MDPHDKRFGGTLCVFPGASGGVSLRLRVTDARNRGAIGLRCPGMKEGCSGENVLERER